MALRTVGVRLVAEIADYQRKMGSAQKSTKDFTTEMSQAAKRGGLDTVADQAGVVGLSLTAMAAGAVNSAAKFEKAMSGVAAATHASAGEIKMLKEAALQAGKDTAFSATQAADAITELSKAGVSAASILGGGLQGALDLAAAGQLDVGEAAETAASAMTQFGLSGKDVPHIADLLAAAAGKAQGSVHDMGYALSQAGLVANQFGLTIEDTTGTLAALASAGLTGSDAGTSLKTALLHLANPSEETSKNMQKLGLSAYDASGQFIGVTKLAAMLQTQLGDLTQEQRDATLAMMFGSDGIRVANVLYKQGAAGIQGWIDKVNDAGYASETAKIQTDNLIGDLERLKGSLETMAIEAGSGANGGLRKITQAAGALVDEISNLPPVISQTLTILAGLSGALLLAGAGWVKARRATADMLIELREVGPTGEKAARGLQSTTKWAGRAAAAFAVFEVASAAVSAAQDDLAPQVDAVASGLAEYGRTGKLAGESARVLGADLSDLAVGFKFIADESAKSKWVKNLQGGLESLIPGLDGTNTSLTRTRERIDAMDQALAQLVAGGHAAEAKEAFDRIQKSLAVNGVSLEEVRKQFNQYAAATEVAGKATTGTAGDMEKMAGTAESTAEAVKELSGAFDELFKVQMTADRAAIGLKKSTNDLMTEIGKGTKSLSLNSEEGRKNRSAVLDNLEAIEELRDARVKGGMTMDEASKKYTKDIEGLRKIMVQAGFSRTAIDKLIGKYEEIPTAVTTKVSATGVAAVEAQFNRLAAYQAGLKAGTIKAGQFGPYKGADGKYFAEGGWTGPGAKYDQAGVVHADEFVIQKSSRQKIEAAAPGMLDEMNQTGKVPGYADGGRVATWPFRVSAAMTKIPTKAQVASVVGPPGGATDDWIVRTVKAKFPQLDYISKFRPGSITLTGNRSYHSMHRAVDWPANHALAQWWHDTFASRTKELITPWNELNIHNGQPHRYTGAVWNQHNFAGGNAHDHIAMKNGGIIDEPIVGVGASGSTYSFGENWQRERVSPMSGGGGGGLGTTVVINFSGPVGSQPQLRDWLADSFDDLKRRGRV